MLLDLDDRFTQFYAPTHYQHYNMAVNHFFEDSGQGYLEVKIMRGIMRGW